MSGSASDYTLNTLDFNCNKAEKLVPSSYNLVPFCQVIHILTPALQSNVEASEDGRC